MMATRSVQRTAGQLILISSILFGLWALVQFLVVQATPTGDVLSLADTLKSQGRLGRLHVVADSAPESPLGKMMKAGLVARHAGASPKQAMTASLHRHLIDRWVLAIVALLLTIVGAVLLWRSPKGVSTRASLILLIATHVVVTVPLLMLASNEASLGNARNRLAEILVE